MAASNSTWEQKHLPIVQFSFRIDFHSSSGWNNIPHTWLKIMLFLPPADIDCAAKFPAKTGGRQYGRNRRMRGHN